VSIYVAAITAAAGIIGAVIPQAAIVLRDVRRAERDRQERFLASTRDACVELLRAAGELRTCVQNIHSYRGDAAGLRTRLEEVRADAAATQLHAAWVGLLVPDRLAAPADQLVDAASKLADAVEQNADVDHGVMVGKPDVSQLDMCVATFRAEALSYAGGPTPPQ